MIDFNKNRDTLKYLIVITFVLNIFLPNIFSVCHIQYNGLLSSVVCVDYMVYVLTGYYLDNNEISKKNRMIIYTVSLVGLCVHFFGTGYASFKNHEMITIFKGYLNFPCYLYSVGIFILVKYIKVYDYKKVNFFMEKISKYTFGMYMVHFFVIDFARRVLLFDEGNILYKLIGTFVYFGVCVFIIELLRKIPYVKKILP